jgi:hypothetical protein
MVESQHAGLHSEAASLESLTPHMPQVRAYSTNLDALAERWNLLTLLGQMSNIGMDMSETREGFQDLTQELLHHLGTENLKKVVSEMQAKAQVAVDIVIRNLFERTADIGFLATDDDFREFIAALEASVDRADAFDQGFGDADVADEAAVAAPDKVGGSLMLLGSGSPPPSNSYDALKTRFREYVAKYSVYDNIVLLSPDGRVLAQLDDDNPVSQSRDPLIREAIETTQEYVEVYRPSWTRGASGVSSMPIASRKTTRPSHACLGFFA